MTIINLMTPVFFSFFVIMCIYLQLVILLSALSTIVFLVGVNVFLSCVTVFVISIVLGLIDTLSFFLPQFSSVHHPLRPLSEMNLRICSLNLRGLGDKLERRQMFNWSRKKKYSIYTLQEVHCSKTQVSRGRRNGAIKLSFAVTIAPGVVSLFYLTIPSISKFKNPW